MFAYGNMTEIYSIVQDNLH